jgi:pimeloyl-ACP methyl ester carboxylesterase
MNKKLSEINLFSGLGADERVFQYLDFGKHKVHFVKWIKPKEKESLPSYAKRISVSIKSENPILMGLSFGGIVAIEVAKHIPVKQVLLVSSAKSKRELPELYRLVGKMNLHKMVPADLLKKGRFLVNWLFGVNSKMEKILLRNIIEDTDEYFLKWAINALLKWDNEVVPSEVKQIHGDRDRLLPVQNLKADVIIKGGHFIIVNQRNKIQSFINEVLKG